MYHLHMRSGAIITNLSNALTIQFAFVFYVILMEAIHVVLHTLTLNVFDLNVFESPYSH